MQPGEKMFPSAFVAHKLFACIMHCVEICLRRIREKVFSILLLLACLFLSLPNPVVAM